MKNTLKMLAVMTAVVCLASCSGVNSDNLVLTTEPTSASQTTEAQTSKSSYTVDTTPGTVKDTNGNVISSGSASVSFDGKTQTINAEYLIDGVDVEITSGAYSSDSSDSDEVVFLVVNGGSLTIAGTETNYVGVTKTGSGASNGQVGDEYNFYGINSAVVTAGEDSTANIKYTSISTDANGSNAVVSTSGANVDISNSVIATTGESGSRGLHSTYGGTINADCVDISTQGKSCASLATDRGGGTVNASNMTLETNGAGSPLIYSTGVINVSSSTGCANGAQMVVVEGGSQANVTDCDFECSGDGNRTGTSESNSSSHTVDSAGIFIYQSFSGDSSEGTDYFTAVNSTFTVKNAGVPMFYITNITADVTLNGNKFVSANEGDYLIIAEEQDEWGNTGNNGGKTSVTLTNQNLSDYTAFVGTSSSSLNITASDSSSTDISVTNGTW